MKNDMDDIGMVSEGQGAATAEEQGFTLAILLIAMALMAIAWSVALPVWRTAAQREREEELLFRARQYARGVMLFQRKTPGVFPPSVDAMLERKVLRKKYRDPMWPGGEFLVVRAGQVVPGELPPGFPTPGGGPGGGPSPRPGLPPTAPPAGAPGGDDGGAGPRQGGTPGQPGPFGAVGAREEVGIDAKLVPGGIAGVVSRSKAESIKEFKGKKHYNEWIVTIQDVLPRVPGQQQPQQGPGPPQPPGPTAPTSPTSPTLPRS
jgi:type II secretory pathway pseudopilin PulG